MVNSRTTFRSVKSWVTPRHALLILTTLSIAAYILLFLNTCNVYAGSNIFNNYVNYDDSNKNDYSFNEAVAIGDINNDRKNEAVMTDGSNILVYCLRDAKGAFMSPPLRYFSGGNGGSVAIADLNNDKKYDVVVSTENGIAVLLHNNTYYNPLNPPIFYKSNRTGNWNPNKIVTGDFNSDGLTDVAAIEWGTQSDDLDIYLQNNSGSLEFSKTYQVPHDGYDDIAVGDLNNDQRDDIVVSSGQGYIHTCLEVMLQNDHGTFDDPISYDPGYYPRGIGVGDINNDTVDDISMSSGINGDSSLETILDYVQTEDEAYCDGWIYDSQINPKQVEVGDINMDGLNDVVVAYDSNIGVYLQNADGTLEPEELYGTPIIGNYNTHAMAIGDMNGDGSNDLALASMSYGLVVLYNKIVPELKTNAAISQAAESDSGWVAEKQTIEMTTNIPAKTYYQWDSSDNNSWNTYSSPFEALEGEHTLYYYSETAVGEKESINQKSFRVDTEHPEITRFDMPSDPTLTGTITVEVSANDTESGISSIQVLADGYLLAEDNSPPYSIDIDTRQLLNTDHDLSILAMDNAYNYTYSESKHINSWNTDAPVVSIPLSPEYWTEIGFGVSLLFEGITSAGQTRIKVDTTTPQPNASIYRLIGSVYDISSTVGKTGSINLDFSYGPAISNIQADKLRLLHWENGRWEDVTVENDPEYRSILGEVNTLSPFALVEQIGSPPNDGTDTDTDPGSDTGNNNNNNGSGGGSGGGGTGGGSSGGGSGNTETQKAYPAPKDLTAKAAATYIHLDWKPVVNAKGYFVYRKDQNSGFDKLSKTAIKTVRYTDTEVQAGVTYTYYVVAIDRYNNEGQASDQVSASLVEVLKKVQEPVKRSHVFKDVPNSAWYKEYVTTLADKRIIAGYSDNTFRPNTAVSRAEFAKIICVAMGWSITPTTDTPIISFTDVKQTDWAYSYIRTAAAHWAISGYSDGTFKGSNSITRAEIAAVIARVKGLNGGSSKLNDISKCWAKDHINACVSSGIISGYPNGTFKPSGYATRAEIAKMIVAILK